MACKIGLVKIRAINIMAILYLPGNCLEISTEILTKVIWFILLAKSAKKDW